MQRQNLNKSLILLLAIVLAVISAVTVVSQTATVPQRSDIDDKYKWKVEDMYVDLDAWEKDFNYVKENLSRLGEFKGHLGESAEMILGCLQLSDHLNTVNDNLFVYAYLKLDEDNRVSACQELTGRISTLNAELGEAESFIEPELLSVDSEKLQSFLNGNDELEAYRFYFENLIRQKQHILSPGEETILALAEPVTDAPEEIFTMLTAADVSWGTVIAEDGNEVELTRGRYERFAESPDRRLRRDANRVYNEAYLKYLNTLSASLAGSLKKDYFLMKARGYNSCLESSLSENNIPTSVFYNLIDAVNANLEPLHKWTALRKKILKLDTLYTYDLYAPLIAERKKEYTYEEALEIVLNGLRPMGDRYVADVEKGFSSGWIDVFETQGKGTGGYEWGTYTSHPYILMNYNGTLEWVFAIAHEMGHALHEDYTNRNEPYHYADHSLFLAEVASTCNEAILMKHLLQNTRDKNEKITLLNYYIEQIVGTFYTQVMYSEFERAVHERVESGGAFSADYFRETYRDIYQKYWGPELVIGPINDMGGMRISHFYRQFYVYQYATGYAAAQLMSKKILSGENGFLDTYHKFLATGRSKYPVELLKEAGVDMTTPEAVNYTLKLFGELVDEMERLLTEG
ncbi:MAG: oligoendopeptidase F [candidate division Zixibacteria bacterium]|nr:oligoendopeptidase F [candidate division Zixibacteria bacterium]